MKKIITSSIITLCITIICFGGFNVSAQVSKNPTITIEVQSYDPVKKQLEIKGSATAYTNGAYTFAIEHSQTAINPITGKKPQQLLYANPLMIANQTEFFQGITVTGISPGNLTITPIMISGTVLTRLPTITLTIPTTLFPGPVITVASITPDGIDTIVPANTQVTLSGVLSVTKTGQYSVNLLLGTSATNITKTVPLLTNTTVTFLKKHSWSQIITGLTPCTSYVYTLRNVTTNSLISPVYGFKTTGTCTPTSTGGSVFGSSPAGTDNSGQGGIFSYQYPTNIGAPDQSGWSIFGSSTASLVPCTAQGDITTRCRFTHLMQLIANVANFLLVLLLPCIALLAAITGIQMVINQKKPDRSAIDIMKYKQRFFQVMVGLVVILISWMIVATVLNAVLGDEAKQYVLLDLASLK